MEQGARRAGRGARPRTWQTIVTVARRCPALLPASAENMHPPSQQEFLGKKAGREGDGEGRCGELVRPLEHSPL